MKQNGRTINSYFIFIILLVMVIVGLNLLSNREEDYTRAEFIADLDAGNVSEIVIQPNGEAPTGYLEIQMKNGLNHKLYAHNTPDSWFTEYNCHILKLRNEYKNKDNLSNELNYT